MTTETKGLELDEMLGLEFLKTKRILGKMVNHQSQMKPQFHVEIVDTKANDLKGQKAVYTILTEKALDKIKSEATKKGEDVFLMLPTPKIYGDDLENLKPNWVVL